jgi:hypothetical protein
VGGRETGRAPARGSARPCFKTSATKFANAISTPRIAGVVPMRLPIRLPNGTFLRLRSAGSVWPAATSLQNDFRVSPSLSASKTGRRQVSHNLAGSVSLRHTADALEPVSEQAGALNPPSSTRQIVVAFHPTQPRFGGASLSNVNLLHHSRALGWASRPQFCGRNSLRSCAPLGAGACECDPRVAGFVP